MRCTIADNGYAVRTSIAVRLRLRSARFAAIPSVGLPAAVISPPQTPKAPLVDGAFLVFLSCAGAIRPTCTWEEETLPYNFSIAQAPDRRRMPETWKRSLDKARG